MKTYELRIGNWVKIPTKVEKIIIPTFEAKVQGIRMFGMIDFLNTPQKKGVKWSVKSISPIILTDEWFLRFGFEKAVNGWWDESENFSVEYGMFRDGTNEIVKCDFVHELQNLMFYCSGSELKDSKPSKASNGNK